MPSSKRGVDKKRLEVFSRELIEYLMVKFNVVSRPIIKGSKNPGVFKKNILVDDIFMLTIYIPVAEIIISSREERLARFYIDTPNHGITWAYKELMDLKTFKKLFSELRKFVYYWNTPQAVNFILGE